MKGHRNLRAEAGRASTNEWFYNHCTRLLLERITEFVEKRNQEDHGGAVKHVKIVFSKRENQRYSQTVAYIDLVKNQARAQITLLNKRVVRWQVLHTQLITCVPHKQNAGVQLADIIASSFYCAADANSPTLHDTRYAETLRDRMWANDGVHADHGVALQPMPPWKAKLADKQKAIFRYYGFKF